MINITLCRQTKDTTRPLTQTEIRHVDDEGVLKPGATPELFPYHLTDQYYTDVEASLAASKQ